MSSESSGTPGGIDRLHGIATWGVSAATAVVALVLLLVAPDADAQHHRKHAKPAGKVSVVADITQPDSIAAAARKRGCSDGAKWRKVRDDRPVKLCRKRPLEEGCMLEDGRKHGAWIRWDKTRKCKQPLTIRMYDKGRKHGMEHVFVAACAGKGKREKCTYVPVEAGPYRDDKRHGVWTRFRDDGSTLESGNYFDGQRHGPWTRFAANGKALEVVCMQADEETWKATPQKVAGSAMPCAVTQQKKKQTGIKQVSAAEQKASKLVHLAQSTTKLSLRVRYLQKAVSLVPANAHYRQLLDAARAQAEDAAK